VRKWTEQQWSVVKPAPKMLRQQLAEVQLPRWKPNGTPINITNQDL